MPDPNTPKDDEGDDDFREAMDELGVPRPDGIAPKARQAATKVWRRASTHPDFSHLQPPGKMNRMDEGSPPSWSAPGLGPLSFSDEDAVGPDTVLRFHRPGISPRQLKRLRHGKLPIARSLDLHGMPMQQAERSMAHFIEASIQPNGQCVRIIHGKGGPVSRLKQRCNTYLQSHPRVLAFHSCLARHGHTGALYLLLKQ
jgi:DNA-nicking Smr family endonuclease